jgi:hypothetical protein
VLNAATTVNLGAADQTTGDSTNVANFQNVDGSSQSANLTLTGSSGSNIIQGGSGNDTIDGGGGLDHLFGNGGDDFFMVDGSSLNLGTTIDGGAGNNSVSIAANSGTITDTELVASLTNIQSIDFSASGNSTSLNLSGSQISQIDGGASNTLTMHFSASESLNITDPTANYTSAVSGSTTNYTIYDNAAHDTVIAHVTTIAA